MAHRDEIIAFLNELLKVDEFNDQCVNGLQVEGKSEVQKIVLGVSVSERLFNAAIQKAADLILVHHGLFWSRDAHPFALTGITRRRLALLLQHDINLVGYHLPLDAHPEVGNNIQLLKRLDLEPCNAVGIGFVGQLRQPTRLEHFVRHVNQQLQTQAMVFPYGASTCRRVLVISGASSSAYPEAVALGVDTFLGGDIREENVRAIEETGLNYIAAGHYNTEKFGLLALSPILKNHFVVETHFVDIPNPV